MKKLFSLAACCAALILSSCSKEQCWTFAVKQTTKTWCGNQFTTSEQEYESAYCNLSKAEAHKLKRQIEASSNVTYISPGCIVKRECSVSIK